MLWLAAAGLPRRSIWEASPTQRHAHDVTRQDQELPSFEHIVSLVLEHGTDELADAFSPLLNLGTKVEFSRALATEP